MDSPHSFSLAEAIGDICHQLGLPQPDNADLAAVLGDTATPQTPQAAASSAEAASAAAAAQPSAFDGYDYAVMVEGDQGMAWTTAESRALNRTLMDDTDLFRIVGVYRIPSGAAARLYAIERGKR